MPKPPAVTAAILSQRIGERLKARREDRQWSATEVSRQGGPSYHTILKTEGGNISGFFVLEQHAHALGLTLEDVLADALLPPGQDGPRVSRDASDLARVFDQADPEGQEALTAMKLVLDQVSRRRRLASARPAGRRSAR